MLNTVLNILLVILIIAAVILAILYFLGNKLQKRQLEQQQMLDAAAQTVSLLVIDKLRCTYQPFDKLFRVWLFVYKIVNVFLLNN